MIIQLRNYMSVQLKLIVGYILSETSLILKDFLIPGSRLSLHVDFCGSGGHLSCSTVPFAMVFHIRFHQKTTYSAQLITFAMDKEQQISYFYATDLVVVGRDSNLHCMLSKLIFHSPNIIIRVYFF